METPTIPAIDTSGLLFAGQGSTPSERRMIGLLESNQQPDLNRLRDSIVFIKSTRRNTDSTSISLTENSRINEQELFASIAHYLTGKLSSGIRTTFESTFSRHAQSEELANSAHAVLQATRRSLRSLVQDNEIPQIVARAIRRIALGKAQLDDDRTTLRTERQPGATETPLRSLKIAFDTIQTNPIATGMEHTEFKHFVADEVRPTR